MPRSYDFFGILDNILNFGTNGLTKAMLIVCTFILLSTIIVGVVKIFHPESFQRMRWSMLIGAFIISGAIVAVKGSAILGLSEIGHSVIDGVSNGCVMISMLF